MSVHEERLYRIWCNMKSRCYNKKFPKYKTYGNRGIKICEEWVKNYKEFKKWAFANGYEKELSIDRINNDGDYCPENCRWATAHQQCVNQGIRSDNKSGYIGVFKKGNVFCAGLRLNKKQIWVGCSFKTPEEACIARDRFIIDNNLTEYKTQILKR